MPGGGTNTGPNCVCQKVWETLAIEPSGCRTSTCTVSGCMASTCPSYRYEVGLPGAIVSSRRMKRRAVETVWLQARCRLKPMFTSGKP